MYRPAISALLLVLGACETDPMQGSLSENVGMSFSPCSEAEIRFMTQKHNFMTAFRPCGNNDFTTFSWAPDGKHLYFQLVMTAYVMDAEAENKQTVPVPSRTPIGPAAWLSTNRVAVPEIPLIDDGPAQIALFDIEGQTVFHIDLPKLKSVRAIQRGRTPNELLLLGDESDGTLYAFDTSDGTLGEAFSWLKTPVDTMSYTHQLDVLVVSRGNATTVHEGASGKAMGTWSPAKRGTLHADGRWLALEHDGEEISIFYQRSWDELSEKARERELRRLQKYEETIKGDFPTRVQPPTLSFVDLHDGKRWMISSVYGSQFQWYEPTPYFGSLMMWGFEGKQMKRNVLLGDMGGRFHMVENDRTMMGITRFPEGEDSAYVPPGTPPSPPATPASPSLPAPGSGLE
jgi:hypothetical protein